MTDDTPTDEFDAIVFLSPGERYYARDDSMWIVLHKVDWTKTHAAHLGVSDTMPVAFLCQQVGTNLQQIYFDNGRWFAAYELPGRGVIEPCSDIDLVELIDG